MCYNALPLEQSANTRTNTKPNTTTRTLDEVHPDEVSVLAHVLILYKVGLSPIICIKAIISVSCITIRVRPTLYAKH